MRKRLVSRVLASTALFAALGFLPSAPSYAWTPHSLQWPTAEYNFWVNSANYVTHIPELPLTEAQWRTWIHYAASQWKSATGLGWQFNYQGTTTRNGCNAQARDGFNVVDASPLCGDVNCTWLGSIRAWAVPGSTTVRGETDLCIWKGAGSFFYSTRSDDVPSGYHDVVQVLVHEFGHVVGLEHEPKTVMDEVRTPDSVIGRFLTHDDIVGARALFPGTPTYTRSRAWRKRTGSTSWGAETHIPSANQWLAPTGAVGNTSAQGHVVVVDGVNDLATVTHFTRATYPLTSASIWNNVAWSYATWRRPAIASAGAEGTQWVAALTTPALLDGCGNIRIIRSTTAFVSGATSVLATDCTQLGPALAYESTSGRFVLLYVQKAINGAQNRLFARTSADGGATWTASQDLGMSAVDTPSLTCKPGINHCMLGYLQANAHMPTLTTRRIFVATSGHVTLDVASSNSSVVQHAPGVGYSTHYEDWMVGMVWPSSEVARANSEGRVYTAMSLANPIASYLWSSPITGWMTTPVSFITGNGYVDDYMIYAID